MAKPEVRTFQMDEIIQDFQRQLEKEQQNNDDDMITGVEEQYLANEEGR